MTDSDTSDTAGDAATGEEPPGETASDGEAEGRDEPRYAVVLDHLPTGKPDDNRPRNKKSPVAYALGERDFRLYELTLEPDADVGFADRVAIAPADARDAVERFREVEYDDLTRAATQEVEYAVEAIVDGDEQRFVDFYNDAQPITLRLHRLNLLPGIGKKLRNNILDERKRGPFESFEDLEDRVSGLHRPKELLVERIVEEIREDDLKYRAFVGGDSSSGE
ncbi:DUF655 domain-containing protein [Halobaculum sp. D14]|uniref:DUF655 domain-containing protein n=1 Tax=unclassified Halobaculum TaxID=2640896 RepID=UPI003EB92859